LRWDPDVATIAGVKASDRFTSAAGQATCSCCGSTYEVRDLSVGGCFLVGEAPPPAGNAMTLTLKVGDIPPFEARATVVWLNDGKAPRAPELPRGFGVHFVDVGLRERAALIQYLRHLAEREGRR
jgi:hypothetical protein